MEIQSFIEAIQNKNSAEIEKWHNIVQRMLSDYLRIHFRASAQDAEDCAQEAVLKLIELIQKDEPLPEKMGGYVRTIAKNALFKIMRHNRTKVGDEILEFEEDGLDPSEILVQSEMKRLLQLCIKKLDEFQRTFIQFWLGNPGVRAEEVATRFELTPTNVWVRRHRINKQLEICIRKKM